MDASRMVGLGIRLSKSESKRLAALARASGRSKNSVIRALVRLAGPRDVETMGLLRQASTIMEAEDATF